MQSSADYDVVIIGAGIQGAGVAQAAAANGYRTLVIEKFAGPGLGTSSKSSKLIHGGLRYLESGQLSLVKECLDERRTLLKIAPHLVRLIRFYIPVYTSSNRPSWYIWLGLFLYSLLSFKAFTRIKRSHWVEFDEIKQGNLRHLFMYYDAQTDDTALTQAVIRSACELGASVSYNSTFDGSSFENGLHRIHYSRDKQQHFVTSQSIINCSGPWVQEIQSLIRPSLTLPEIELIAGTHIILNTPPSKHGAFYLQAIDNRAIFVIPWNNQTLVGTTERLFSESPDRLEPTESEIGYLLENYNHHFNRQAQAEDISASFCGLRVLPTDSKDAFSRSRDSLILQHPERPEVITLIGGKLTAYRASSEQVIKQLMKTLPTGHRFRSTDSIPLPDE